MDYLQYFKKGKDLDIDFNDSFKPCYKWITFNTYCNRRKGDIYNLF